MEKVYDSKMKELGYNQLVTDIFLEWENVKDEILLKERKSGTGSGTVHVFLGAADDILRQEFASYYEAVENGKDPSDGAVTVRHYFLASNVLSMIGYLCQYCQSQHLDFSTEVNSILNELGRTSDERGLLKTTSLFKLSTGSNRLRPYFKQFDESGVFYRIIRHLLLPKSAYKVSLYKDEEGEYAAFWLIGFNYLSNFEADSSKLVLQQTLPSTHNSQVILPYLTALRTKPFVLLAGISGTGKSRIVRKLAQATTTQQYAKDEDRWKDNRPKNFELIQVKPNWHNSMDVVGFYSNVSKKYEFTPFVKFIVKAWQEKSTPYFLCLDEMNLAPVEEYFAEFLSAIESRTTDDKGEYITDPIIKPFKDFEKGKEMLVELFGTPDPIDKDPLANHLYEKGLTLPPNLLVLGTVNMDETTFSFSRKVLDRAMSIEMNEVNYDKFLSGESDLFPLLTEKNKLLVKRPQKAFEVKDMIDGKKVIEYLDAINKLFEGTPFKLGYRAANEAILYVSACQDFDREGFSIGKALDEFTLMKILSRIEGDDNRLALDEDDPRVLDIGLDAIKDNGEDRVNLLNCLRAIVRQHIGSNTETEKKINTMYRTLSREHFVSYWA